MILILALRLRLLCLQCSGQEIRSATQALNMPLTDCSAWPRHLLPEVWKSFPKGAQLESPSKPG